MRRAFVRRLRHWVANRGWRGLLVHVTRSVRSRVGAAMTTRSVPTAGEAGAGPAAGEAGATAMPVWTGPTEVHPFDTEYGVDTGGLIWSESLRTGERSEYWATGYYGIAPSVLWQSLDRLDLDWPRFTFVDVGSGKGRGLMLALKYPFRAVLGVELSPELTRVAQENLRCFRPGWRRELPAEAVVGDATRMELPGGDLLLYLYHPFAAPVMEVMLARVREAIRREPREVYLLYMNPELDARLGAMPYLERLWRVSLRLSEDDTRADRFGSNQEVVSAYRFLGDAAEV